MGLKSDITRLRRIDDLDRGAFVAAQRRHEARMAILDYERDHLPYFEIIDDHHQSELDPTCETCKHHKYIETDVAMARDRLGEDSPERWRADQDRIERYLLRTSGNLDAAQQTRAWGVDTDTMWAASILSGLIDNHPFSEIDCTEPAETLPIISGAKHD